MGFYDALAAGPASGLPLGSRLAVAELDGVKARRGPLFWKKLVQSFFEALAAGPASRTPLGRRLTEALSSHRARERAVQLYGS